MLLAYEVLYFLLIIFYSTVTPLETDNIGMYLEVILLLQVCCNFMHITAVSHKT